jgi:hypothetical protein
LRRAGWAMREGSIVTASIPRLQYELMSTSLSSCDNRFIKDL